MKMKLTKTQAALLEEMKAVIDTAKKYETFESYFENEIKTDRWGDDYIYPEHTMNFFKRQYEMALQNIVVRKANTKTFEKLSKLELIEVLEYNFFINHDLIKVLN